MRMSFIHKTHAWTVCFLFGLDASLSFLSTSRRWWNNEIPRHLRDVERNDMDASKLPNHSKQHMAVCGLSLHLGNSESRKTLEQKLIFQTALLIPTVSTSAFHSTYLFLFSRRHIPTNSVANKSTCRPLAYRSCEIKIFQQLSKSFDE